MPSDQRLESLRNAGLPLLALAGLAIWGALELQGLSRYAGWSLIVPTAIVLVASCMAILRRLVKGDVGVDVIGVVAIAGALALRQYLAGAIIALMLTSGTALERFAISRARRELSALIQRAPRTAHRRSGEIFIDTGVAEVKPADILLIKPGEVIPVDGIVHAGTAMLDESALTGEARPVGISLGGVLRSGGTNAGAPFELRATSTSEQSTYAGILRLVRNAEEAKAPFLRLADRYATAFLALTLLVALAAWLVEGSLLRALAVLVVATPCPLILAAPAAIMGGISRAARHGIIVKGGGALETLARTRVLLLDKTGTVTAARPEVVAVESFGADTNETVRLAASLEQVSAHPYAPAVLNEARTRDLQLSFPSDVHEQVGAGIRGRVDERMVSVGQLAFVAPGAPRTAAQRSIETRTAVEGSSSIHVAVDGVLAAALIVQDPIRPEAARALRAARSCGIQHIHLVTGDHPDVAELVGDVLGIDRVYAERTPEEKVEVVRLVRAQGVTAMVGDGINDAPALALADVGIAMGARGATAASEAADVVLTSDRLEGLSLAIKIAQRTRRIALESIIAGMGLSLLAMICAAAGRITPVAGALLQEGIDVLVILNALRALGQVEHAASGSAASRRLAQELADAHRALRSQVNELAALASSLETLSPAEARPRLAALRDMLERELLPHERKEQENVYPLLGKMLKDEDPTGLLIQTHHEIRRLVRLFARLVDRLPAEGPGPEDLRDLRRVLYALHAVLTLHFSQEEELYSLLNPA